MKCLLSSLSFDLKKHSLSIVVEMEIQDNTVYQSLSYTDSELYAMRDKLDQKDWDFGTVCKMASETLGGVEVLPPPEYLDKY